MMDWICRKNCVNAAVGSIEMVTIYRLKHILTKLKRISAPLIALFPQQLFPRLGGNCWVFFKIITHATDMFFGKQKKLDSLDTFQDFTFILEMMEPSMNSLTMFLKSPIQWWHAGMVARLFCCLTVNQMTWNLKWFRHQMFYWAFECFNVPCKKTVLLSFIWMIYLHFMEL